MLNALDIPLPPNVYGDVLYGSLAVMHMYDTQGHLDVLEKSRRVV